MINEVHTKQLIDSGLTESTISRLGWYSATEGEVRSLLGYKDNAPCGPGLVIRYPNSNIYRVRFDTAREYESEGRTHHQRYATPRGGESGLYVPRKTSETLANNPKAPLYITEGEKKAEALAQEGFAAVGIPGISMWSDSGARADSWDDGVDTRPLLPDLELLIQSTRVVVIAFDSPDMQGRNEHKRDAIREAIAFAKAIRDRGGVPMLCLLPWDEYTREYPEDKEPDKLGADDLLAAWGSARFCAAMKCLTPAEPSHLLSYYTQGERILPDGTISLAPDSITVPDPDDLEWIMRWVSAWIGFKKALGKWLQRAVKAKWISEDRAEEILDRIRQESGYTAEKWLNKWLTRNRVVYSYSDASIRLGGVRTGTEALFARLRLDRDNSAAPWSDRAIDDAWTLWTKKQDQTIPRAIVQNLERNRAALLHPSDTQIRRWVRAVTGKESHLDIAVMRHFVWQVKRKVLEKDVIYHLMTVVYGPSGMRGGKTTAIERLLAPLSEVVGTMEVDRLTDSREYFRLARFPVLVLDEMSRASKADVETLKNIITTRTISYRLLGTNKMVADPQRATFIGSSNRPINEIIIDPTSARRYWQIDASADIDWDGINSIDYEELWRSVDADEPCPLLPYLDEIDAKQRTDLRAKDPIEQWLDECTAPSETGMSPSELHNECLMWLRKTGHKMPLTLAKFARELARLGVQQVRTSQTRRYLIQTTDVACMSDVRKIDRLLETMHAKAWPGQLK